MENIAKKLGTRNLRKCLPAPNRKEWRSQGAVRRPATIGVPAKAASQSQPYSGGQDSWVTTGAPPCHCGESYVTCPVWNSVWREVPTIVALPILPIEGPAALSMVPWQVVKLSVHWGLAQDVMLWAKVEEDSIWFALTIFKNKQTKTLRWLDHYTTLPTVGSLMGVWISLNILSKHPCSLFWWRIPSVYVLQQSLTGRTQPLCLLSSCFSTACHSLGSQSVSKKTPWLSE